MSQTVIGQGRASWRRGVQNSYTFLRSIFLLGARRRRMLLEIMNELKWKHLPSE